MKEQLPSDPAVYYIRDREKCSIAELAKIYAGRKGCSEAHLERRSAAEEWKSQRRKYAGVVQEKVLAKASDEDSEMNVRHLRDAKDTQALARAALAAIVAKMHQMGGAERMLDDPRMAAFMVMILRRAQLTLRGGVDVERKVIGKGRDPLLKILRAAELAAAEMNAGENGAPVKANGNRNGKKLEPRMEVATL